MIHWLIDFFRKNEFYRIDNGDSDVPPQAVDAEGVPGARESLSSMFVRDQYSEFPIADKTTGIVVRRPRVVFGQNAGIGNFQGRIAQPRPFRRENGKGIMEIGQEFTMMVTVPVQICCLSKVGAEADDMADLVSQSLIFAREHIPKLYPALHDVRVQELGEEQPVRMATSQSELVMVPVSASVEIQQFWQVYKRGDLPFRFVNFGVVGAESTA